MEIPTAVAALLALAQRSRLEVFRLLMRAGPEGLPAGEIARRVGAPANTMSTHLAVLGRAGLLSARREGRVIYHAIETDGVRRLMTFLLEDCCGGRPDLCAPLLDCLGPSCGPAKVSLPTREGVA
jgi:ArsR family transcriptional regulator, arsenate/arsenite/antimonite-responsive transcriptional repressor